jgi:hypothetical protein
MGKSEGKKPIEKLKCRWVRNTKMNLREAEFGNVDWIGLAQDKIHWRALVNTVMKPQFP